MGYFTVQQINDHIYQFKDALGSLIDLVIGKEKALVVDTGYGIGDLRSEISKYTNLPLIVIDSHGHMDHSCGSYQFDEVYIDKDDYELFKLHNSEKQRRNNIERAIKASVLPDSFDIDAYIYNKKENIKFIDFTSFDIGGINVEVIKTPGHTKGSISLYLKEDKMMISSDEACAFVWLFLKESTGLKTHIKSLEKCLAYPFDSFLVGHVIGSHPKHEFLERIEICKNVDLKDSGKVSFDGFENDNAYAYPLNDLYKPGKCGIVFDINKMEE